MRKLSGILTDHKLLFPAIEIVSFFIFPYTLGLFRLGYSILSFPTDWMWGLCFFAIASYFVGIAACNRLLRFGVHDRGRRMQRLLILVVVFVLSLRLLLLSSFPLFVSAAVALLAVAAIHFVASAPFSERHSFIMVTGSLAVVLGNFVVMGGVPILNAALLNQAKLSAVREVALPTFLLGAASVSLGSRRTRIESYAVQSIVLGIGGLVFLLNGKRLDVLTIALCFVILLLRRHKAKVSFAIVAALLFSVLGVAFFRPSYLGLFRQEFDFQVLRHIIYYVQDPLLGATHGAVSLGVSQDFLGPRLIYGPDAKWTLTATWLGPAYLDLGLPGVFITMSIAGAVLELLHRRSGKSMKSEVVYVVTLTILLSLYEEGADLFTVVFALTMLYASISGSSLTYESANSSRVIDRIFRTGKTKLALVLAPVGMLTITCAFVEEYGLSTPVVEREVVGDLTAFVARMEAKYYHAELVSTGNADYVEGTLRLTGPNGVSQEFDFNGLFWEAVRDRIEVAWFKPTTEGEYTLRLSVERPDRLERTSIIVEESPLSHLMPNYVLLDLGVGVLVVSCIVVLYEISRHSRPMRSLADVVNLFTE